MTYFRSDHFNEGGSVFAKRIGGTNYSTTYLGTGAGWVKSTEWQVPLDAIADQEGDPGFRILDVKGDGQLDIVFGRDESTSNTPDIKSGVFINTGRGWKRSTSVDEHLPAFVDKKGSDLGVRIFDVDGNGLVDILQSY